MTKYWLAGATFGDYDMTDTFIRRGYWELGYTRGDQPTYDRRLAQMSAGDRVAIKSMLGRGATEIQIKARGIVRGIGNSKDADAEDDAVRRVYIRWLLTGLDRRVPLRGAAGALGSIHEVLDRDRIRQIFTLE